MAPGGVLPLEPLVPDEPVPPELDVVPELPELAPEDDEPEAEPAPELVLPAPPELLLPLPGAASPPPE